MTTAETLSREDIGKWTVDNDLVGLSVTQKLVPIEDSNHPLIFPPTYAYVSPKYADVPYNIDLLSDGTKVAAVDSVGAQSKQDGTNLQERGT